MLEIFKLLFIPTVLFSLYFYSPPEGEKHNYNQYKISKGSPLPANKTTKNCLYDN